MNVYVCMYICMYVCNVCMYVMYVYMYACMCIYICMYVSNIMDTIYASDNALIITSLVNTIVYNLSNSLCTLTVCEASLNP